jgi:hypothetical protein
MCRTALVGSINGWFTRLVTVADAQGLSYYSDKTAARLLSLNEAQLREARRSLLAAGLIAYESPLYQVLSLEPPGNKPGKVDSQDPGQPGATAD